MEQSLVPSKNPLFQWASLKRELLWIYEGPTAAGSLRERSDHRVGYWAWQIRKGSVRVEMGDRTWHATAGQWMITPQGAATQEFTADARILSIHFLCQWPTGENLFLGDDAMVWDSRQVPRLERSATALSRLVHRHLPKVRLELMEQAIGFPVFLKFELHFLQWLTDFYHAMSDAGRVLAQAGSFDERLLRVARSLHEAPLAEPFPVHLLSNETGLGRAHLDRLFWKAFGATTREYWERLRLNAAIQKLESTSLSVKEIGYHLGFKQSSHFTKWFRKRQGQTPKAFRDQPPTERIF